MEVTQRNFGNAKKAMLNQRIVNHNVWDIELSAWSLSVMNEGGRVIIPHEDYKPHPDCLTPARPLVLLYFTPEVEVSLSFRYCIKNVFYDIINYYGYCKTKKYT